MVTGRLKEDRWTSRCLSWAVRGWQGSSGEGGGEAAHLPGLAPDEERCPGLQEAGAPVPEPQFHCLATWGELSVRFPRTSWIFQALITSLPSTCMAPPLPSLGEVSGVLLASGTQQAVEKSTLESGQADSESWFCWTNLGVSGELLFALLSLGFPISLSNGIHRAFLLNIYPCSREDKGGGGPTPPHGASESMLVPPHSLPCSPLPACTHPRVLKLPCILKMQVPWVNTHELVYVSFVVNRDLGRRSLSIFLLLGKPEAIFFSF